MSTITWQGGSSGDWSVAANWSGGAAPQAGDTVIIGDGADVFVTTDEAALNITLGAGSTLEVASTLDLGGTLSGGSLNMTADNNDYWTATFGGTLVGGTLDLQVIQAAPLNFGLSPGLLDGVDYQGTLPLICVGITPATMLAMSPNPVVLSSDLTLAGGTYDGAFIADPGSSGSPLFLIDDFGDIRAGLQHHGRKLRRNLRAVRFRLLLAARRAELGHQPGTDQPGRRHIAANLCPGQRIRH